MTGCENAYRHLPGLGAEPPTDGDISAHGTPGIFEMSAFGPAGNDGPRAERAKSRTIAIRAAMTFFIVGVVIPCLSLALGTVQCVVLMQWLPGEHSADECFAQPAVCFSFGLAVSGISLGVHGFLWVLQLLWAHV